MEPAEKTRLERLWEWFAERSYSVHARVWLAVLSFTESFFFIITPEILMLPMIAAQPRKWFMISLITALASIAGAVIGYVIAYFFFETVGIAIVEWYGFSEEFERLGAEFDDHTFWLMFTAAFTPIPFKIFVLAGGFFQVSFVPFILASILGRGIRYLLVGYGTAFIGPKTVRLALAYANTATIVFMGLIVVAALVWLMIF